MTGIFIAILLLFIPIIYQLNSNVKAKIQNYVIERGGEFIDIHRQGDMFGRYNGKLELIYRDKKDNIHCCNLVSNVFGVTFGEDRILKDDVSIFNYTRANEAVPVYSDDVKEMKKFKTTYGELKIELTSADIEVGNRVFFNGMIAPEGKYKIGFLHYIYVRGGRVA